MEANTVQAQSSRAAVDLEEALSYLKAAQFNSTKAVDIFKNYQVHPEASQITSGFMKVGSRSGHFCGGILLLCIFTGGLKCPQLLSISSLLSTEDPVSSCSYLDIC